MMLFFTDRLPLPLPLLLTVLLFLWTDLSAPETARAQASLGSSASVAEEVPYTNPLILQRADPWVYRHRDGYYYFTATVPEYDRLEVRRAKTIEGLREAEPKVIWRKHDEGPMGAHIWAPELHYIDGKWYIYFAAGGAEDVWAIRMYVLENDSDDPLEGKWTEKGQTKTRWETFSLDATTFEHRGTRYMVWAQHPPDMDGNTALYIAEMDTPWSIRQPQVELTRPDYEWEKQLFEVNEGAAVIKRGDKIFMTYSASGTDHNYAVGLLTADAGANLLDPDSWEKSPEPVFQTSEENGIYGPGHNSFTTTPDGETDLFIYHARSYKEIDGDPLDDPNRHTRVQKVRWTEDGTPLFGEPLPDNRYQKVGSIEQMDPELSRLLDPEARPELIGGGYAWSEGPLWVDEHRFLLFSDIPNNIIYKWEEGEGISEYLKPSGYTGKEERGGELGSNGLMIGREGALILAQHGDRRIARMDAPLTDPEPRFVTLADSFNNKRINTPNDLVQHSNGSIYFTDPPYGFEQRGEDPAQELDFQGVYRLAPSGEMELVTDELHRPNGVALSPDERTLYVGNSGSENPIWMAFDVDEEGGTSNGRVFLDPAEVVDEPGGPDGMVVDEEGTIYSTGPGGVWVITPEAEVLGIIKTGRPTSNCTIGNDGKMLYITADDYLLRLPLK